MRTVLPLLLLNLLAASSAAQAQCDVTARAGAATDLGPPVPAIASEASEYGSHSARASFGSLFASTVVDLPENTSDSGRTTVAEFRDRILIAAPGVPTFTPGTLTASIELRGTPEVSQSATGQGISQGMNTGYQLFLSRNGGAFYSVSGSILYNNSQAPPQTIMGEVPAPGIQTVEIPFSFGVEFELSAFLNVSAGGNNNIPTGASGSIRGQTDVIFLWNGIASIQDNSGGEFLDIATVTSCSGSDWIESQPTSVQGPTPTKVLSLEGNFPNPFNPRTAVHFRLTEPRRVTVAIYDATGRRVASFPDLVLDVGLHVVEWDGRDSAGAPVSSGVYPYRIVAGDESARGRMALLK